MKHKPLDDLRTALALLRDAFGHVPVYPQDPTHPHYDPLKKDTLKFLRQPRIQKLMDWKDLE